MAECESHPLARHNICSGRRAADWRQNKLTSSEYDETTWSARTWLSFVSQRLSVATQLAAAQEVAEALGLSVAADPRLQ